MYIYVNYTSIKLIKMSFIHFYFFIFYLFLERGEGREKEKERNINVREIHQPIASHIPPTEDLVCNPGTCLDWELNQ